jgi:hypothetical protein
MYGLSSVTKLTPFSRSQFRFSVIPGLLSKEAVRFGERRSRKRITYLISTKSLPENLRFHRFSDRLHCALPLNHNHAVCRHEVHPPFFLFLPFRLNEVVDSQSAFLSRFFTFFRGENNFGNPSARRTPLHPKCPNSPLLAGRRAMVETETLHAMNNIQHAIIASLKRVQHRGNPGPRIIGSRSEQLVGQRPKMPFDVVDIHPLKRVIESIFGEVPYPYGPIRHDQNVFRLKQSTLDRFSVELLPEGVQPQPCRYESALRNDRLASGRGVALVEAKNGRRYIPSANAPAPQRVCVTLQSGPSRRVRGCSRHPFQSPQGVWGE